MHNLPSPFKTACEDKHLAGFKKYTKSACLLKCRADYVISMCKCRSYDLEGESLSSIQILKMSLDSYLSTKKKKRIKPFDVSMYSKNEKMLTVKGVKRVEI